MENYGAPGFVYDFRAASPHAKANFRAFLELGEPQHNPDVSNSSSSPLRGSDQPQPQPQPQRRRLDDQQSQEEVKKRQRYVAKGQEKAKKVQGKDKKGDHRRPTKH